MRRILCVLIIAAIVLIGTVAAAPVIPQEFYGAVFLNGNPAPAGTVILAKINGETRGEITTTVEGLYGGAGNFDPKLSVNSTEDEVNAGNVTVTFIVGGVQAFQIVPFKSGGPGKLELIANNRAFPTDTTASPAYSSSGSSSAMSSGSMSGGAPSSSSGSGTTAGISVRDAAVAAAPTTASRSSIYYNADAPQTSPAITVMVTPVATPLPAVATVPTTKKAGAGPLSVVFLAVSIIAALCIIGWTDYTRKRR